MKHRTSTTLSILLRGNDHFVPVYIPTQDIYGKKVPDIVTLPTRRRKDSDTENDRENGLRMKK